MRRKFMLFSNAKTIDYMCPIALLDIVQHNPVLSCFSLLQFIELCVWVRAFVCACLWLWVRVWWEGPLFVVVEANRGQSSACGPRMMPGLRIAVCNGNARAALSSWNSNAAATKSNEKFCGALGERPEIELDEKVKIKNIIVCLVVVFVSYYSKEIPVRHSLFIFCTMC